MKLKCNFCACFLMIWHDIGLKAVFLWDLICFKPNILILEPRTFVFEKLTEQTWKIFA
jgi:hypothetical protein